MVNSFFVKVTCNVSGSLGVGRLTSATEEMDHPRHCQVDLWPQLPFVVHSGLMYTLYKTIVISLSNLASYRAHSLTCALRCIMHCQFDFFDVPFTCIVTGLVHILRFSNFVSFAKFIGVHYILSFMATLLSLHYELTSYKEM